MIGRVVTPERMAEMAGVNPADGEAHRHVALEPKHKIFLSHSGAQKLFVEFLCDELERCQRYPFFDLLEESLPIGESFPDHIFRAIRQCYVGVVILSEEFLTSKWPMMELAAMVEEAKKRADFKLIPVFLRISLADFEDPENRERWQKCWSGLAVSNPGRVVVEDWEAALKYIRPLNSLVNKGAREKEFLNKIVDKICGVVPAEVKQEDSSIQGRSRLCKVVQDKIALQVESASRGVCMVGLYGTGGMGKTTICKTLCDEFSTKFRGRVCHAELERVSEEALLRDVLRRLSNTREEVLNRLNESEMRNGLKEGTFIKDPVFLALDNMSDSSTSMMEAKGYLLAKLPVGSIVMVTSRYRESLARLTPDMDESKCMKMPELEVEEARSLFMKSSAGRIKDDKELVERCVQRCYFYDDGSSTVFHYHPLALDVLGRELAQLDNAEEWQAMLDMVDGDIFKQMQGKGHHPIFSILRKSFDTLSKEDQLLFMDVALYLPIDLSLCFTSTYEWLGMVHRPSRIGDVRKGLERLRRKSLLESVGDERIGSIRMHDLWHAFCVAESSMGDSEVGRWVYEKGACKESSPCESSPSGNSWGNVKRMALLDFSCADLGRVNFAHFPNVTVVKIKLSDSDGGVVVDLSRLVHLKSLEIDGHVQIIDGLPNSLLFLSLHKNSTLTMRMEPPMEYVGDLKELQVLYCRGYKLLDMQNMVSLRKASLSSCANVVTLCGFWPNLQVLDISDCTKLQRCPSVGELVNLEELNISFCDALESLPNLGKLMRLRKLEISSCELITELSGVGDLVALEELDTSDCRNLSKLGDLCKLVNLRVLDLQHCGSITALSGLDSLTSLQELMLPNFQAVVDKSNVEHLTKLQKVEMWGWGSAEMKGLSKLGMLHTLSIRNCSGVDELPDFQSLTRLHSLWIRGSEFVDVSALSNMMELEYLCIRGCSRLKRLPDLQRLTSLRVIDICDCPELMHWDWTLVPEVEVGSYRVEDTIGSLDSPSDHLVMELESLTLKGCGFSDLTFIRRFSQLKILEIEAFPVRELPDLSSFPQLYYLRLTTCEGLEGLVSSKPMSALRFIWIRGCRSFATLPDLCDSFPAIHGLVLGDCNGITMLSICGPLTALTRLQMDRCNSVTMLPDLGTFPQLKSLRLTNCTNLGSLRISAPLNALSEMEVRGCRSWTSFPDLCDSFAGIHDFVLEDCNGITTLSSSGPLVALKSLRLESCNSLTELPDLRKFPALKHLRLKGCSELMGLSMSVPLTALRSLNVEGCKNLSRDDLEHVQALCPECDITDSDDESESITSEDVAHEEFGSVTSEEVPHEEDVRADGKLIWQSRLLRFCPMIVIIGIVSLAWKKKKMHSSR